MNNNPTGLPGYNQAMKGLVKNSSCKPNAKVRQIQMTSDTRSDMNGAVGWQPPRPATPHPFARLPAVVRRGCPSPMPAIEQEYDSDNDDERLSHGNSPGFSPPRSNALTRRVFHLNISNGDLSSTDSSYESER